MVRHKLKKGPKAFSENTLKGLWCALDADNSNELHKDEVAGFLRRGSKSPMKKAPSMKKEHTSASLVGAISGDRVNMNVAIASQPTAEMRAEIEAAGVVLPDDDELTKLSTKLNEWLEEMRHKDGKDKSTSWFNLFAAIDEDGSGFSTLRLGVEGRALVERRLPLTLCTARLARRCAPATPTSPPPPRGRTKCTGRQQRAACGRQDGSAGRLRRWLAQTARWHS